MLDIMMPEDYPERRKLLNQEFRARIPQLYSTEEKRLNAQAQVKFFSPDSGWVWYAAEFDGEDLLYGLVIGNEIELGYFSLHELESAKGAMGLPIELDSAYEPKTLRELIQYHRQERMEEGSASSELFGKLRDYAERLSKGDKRIVEIMRIGNLTDEPGDRIELVCKFDPDPSADSDGFFSIVNLMTRDEIVDASELLDITNQIDLGFEMKNKFYLPDGKIIDKTENEVNIWRRPKGQDYDK